MNQRRTGFSVIVGLVAVVAPLLYALSAGPAYNLVRSRAISEQQYERFYCPVLWLVRVCGPVDQLGKKYRDVWAND